MAAAWTDAQGQARTANMSTSLSALALDVNNPLVDNNSGNDPPKKPIVRQADPTTAGMIPIALGNGDSTAASNPTPELVGRNNNQDLVGTKFNVLTYTPAGSMAVIQQRIETEVLKCTCQYGAGGNNLGEIYRASQWPAVWTGKRYDVYLPDTATTAPGQQYASGPKSGVTQSALCQECCRDHHDNPGDTTNAKFDPEATGTTYQKYDLNGSNQLVNAGNTTSSTYVDSCRIIRVDGFWRTAADMYSRQFGLLETQSVASVQAKTGLPTTAATTAYTTYVKDYLKQYDGTSASAPTNAQSMYDDSTRGLNNPATLTISTPSTSDYRYLHARGLYVDHLEKQARDTLAQALADKRAQGQCAAGSSTLPDCVLPYLPFTTVNMHRNRRLGCVRRHGARRQHRQPALAQSLAAFGRSRVRRQGRLVQQHGRGAHVQLRRRRQFLHPGRDRQAGRRTHRQRPAGVHGGRCHHATDRRRVLRRDLRRRHQSLRLLRDRQRHRRMHQAGHGQPPLLDQLHAADRWCDPPRALLAGNHDRDRHRYRAGHRPVHVQRWRRHDRHQRPELRPSTSRRSATTS